ncbi:MAG: DUF805 domain-containing protein [Saprospiraceae bacterium]|jgi:uncharacterized membrane protein YhaH (DUF805 family)|nr:DUF805 domain-containing protein [Saprospiraceae bacterium]
MEVFLDVVKNKYAEFNGRARRKEFWMYVLVTTLITISCYVVIAIGAAFSNDLIIYFGYFLLILISFGLFIPNLAVYIRRLHDTNRSGWFLLIGVIPFIGFLILLVFLLTEGTYGPNKYGPDPKSPNSELETIGKDELV